MAQGQRLSFTRLTLSLALVVALFGLESKQSLLDDMGITTSAVKILDSKETSVDLESVVEALCDHDTKQQISRLTTIKLLVDYFDREVIDSQHKWADCKKRYEESLDELHEVISVTPENVCSETKLAVMEDFHNRFVSTQTEHVNSRLDAKKDEAPQLLRLFFMHYAMEVDALCKRNLINNLEWDLKEKFGDKVNEKLFELEQETAGSEQQAFGAIFNGALTKFTDLYSVDKYEDVLMIWDLIENSYLSQKLDAVYDDITEDYDLETGEPIRLIVKIRTTKYLNKIKEHCYYNFKPIYRKLILPVIRLADLGYSNSGEQFKVELEELRANENVKRWYTVTQMCETMLPIRFYEDANMDPNSVVVIGKEEAATLDESKARIATGEGLQKLEYEPQTNTMVGMDQLESVASMDGQNLVKSVKSNVSVRDRRIGRAVVKLIKNLRSKFLTTRVGRFFFSEKKDKLATPKSSEREAHYVEQEAGPQFTKSLESLSEADLLKLEGAAGSTRMFKSKDGATGIGRRRRYRRKGDVDILHQQRTEALSYTRTKSWSEIFSGWSNVLSALTPSRTKLIIVGSVLVGVLILMTMLVMMSAWWTAMG